MKLIRAWLILRLDGTNKVLILKRSRKSNNPKQWDFIGGSKIGRRIKPRKLIRKESYEEIGFNPAFLVPNLVVVAKNSKYHYYSSTISNKELANLKLSEEHTKFKLISINKLKHQKNLHHSIKIFLNNE